MTKEEYLNFIATCSQQDFTYKNVIEMLRKTDVNVDNDETFVMAFQEAVRVRNMKTDSFFANYQVKFKDVSTELKSYGVTDEVHNIHNWSIRHYSVDKHQLIRSKMSLEKDGISLKGNTAHRDWLKLGNTGNTFFVLCYKRSPVTDPKFLSTCQFYHEIKLASVHSKIWISQDLMSLDNKSPLIIGGVNGYSLFYQLIDMVKMLKGEAFIKKLVSLFNGSIEVKIPLAIDTTTNGWQNR